MAINNGRYGTLKKTRGETGSQLAEFAPALFILIALTFLPLLDMLQLVTGYTGCWYLNSQQCDTAAQNYRVRGGALLDPPSPQPTVQTQLNNLAQSWQQNPLGKLANLQIPTPAVVAGPTDANGNLLSSSQPYNPPCYLQVTTQVQCSPLLKIPFLKNIPGLSAPVTMSISGQRMVEDATQ